MSISETGRHRVLGIVRVLSNYDVLIWAAAMPKKWKNCSREGRPARHAYR